MTTNSASTNINSGRTYISYAVGKRKSSVARVYVAEGEGKIVVNKKSLEEYFTKNSDQYIVKQPLNLLRLGNKYDIIVNVTGGGTTGQCCASRHGLSRALIKLNSEFRPELKKAGLVTRDSRRVERKKYGQSGARRSFQFSKR